MFIALVSYRCTFRNKLCHNYLDSINGCFLTWQFIVSSRCTIVKERVFQDGENSGF